MADMMNPAFYVKGQIADYDLEGDGGDLVGALRVYAADCRKTAQRYQEDAAAMLLEAARADAAATAAESVTTQPATPEETER